MPQLHGMKTYLCAALLALSAVAYALGWIERATFEVLFGVFNAGGLAALRKGVRDETAALPKPPVG